MGFAFIAPSYIETPCPSPLKTMTLQRFPHHDEDTFAVRLDSKRPRQVAQREIGRLDKSILMTPFSREIVDYKTQPQLFRDDTIESTGEFNAEGTSHRGVLPKLCHTTRCDPFNYSCGTSNPRMVKRRNTPCASHNRTVPLNQHQMFRPTLVPPLPLSKRKWYSQAKKQLN